MHDQQRRKFLLGMAAAGGAVLSGCATTNPQTLRGYNVPAIDLHAHWHAPEFVALIEKEGAANGGKVSKNARGQVVFESPGLGTVFQEQYISLEMRLKAMDATGVDIHALSETSPMVYWATPAFGLKLSQVYNDALAAAHQKYPNRFYGLMTLPMQAPDLAVQELERAAKLPGIRGVYIATHINDKNLDDKAFFPVYARCEALGLPLLLHPINPLAAGRMRSHYLRNFIGNPADTGVAAASLIFGGVMDTFPKLDVVLPHAGGITPILIGRWDHGSGVRPETKHMTKAPSTYLRRFHYDTISHSPQIMATIVKQVGADRVVLGSDHPADMSLERPVDFVESIPDLSRSDRELILGGNAKRLLKLA
jgi:aminocarboxymuconate-semialdehyde decarboxylase